MYLSELRLNEQDAAKWIPRDSYGWHKILWRFFPGNQERPFLYRVDYQWNRLRIYILSSVPAILPEALPEGAFRSKEIPQKFLEHPYYRFQLRANPTKCAKVDKRTGERRERGMRVPLTAAAELSTWIQRKSQQAGFSIPGIEHWPDGDCMLRIVPEGRRPFCKKGLKAAHHASVDFSGILKVEDAAAFRSAFAQGIGSAKAFGFGLLLLCPIS